MTLNKPIELIVEADLNKLIDQKVSERKILEFKSKQLGNSPKEKKEFLADVSSFANASGGHLVFGMDERAGIATELPGISGLNPDNEKQRMEEIIQYGIRPRLIGYTIEPILLINGNHAFVIHIPQSLMSPHMVVYDGTSRFYTRDSTGKHPMDVDEIRQGFLVSGSVGEKIRNFRLERLGQISALETPVPTKEGAKLVLHIVPLTSFQSFTSIDIKVASRDYHKFLQEVTDSRFNIDGLVLYTPLRDETVARYIQLYSNGVFEVVESLLLMQRPEDGKVITVGFERVVINICNGILRYGINLGVELPFFIFLTFLHVKGYKMVGSSNDFKFQEYKYNREIDRNDLILPAISIEDHSSIDNLPILLRPLFDAIWNACGWPGSLNAR
jgi:hypothetical protein